MNVLILGGGEHRLGLSGGTYPVWLDEHGGRSLIEQHLNNFIELGVENFVYVLRKVDITEYHLDDIFSILTPDRTIISLKTETRGAACSALMAIDSVDLDAELVVGSVSDIVECSLSDIVGSFKERSADAGLLCFDSIHPRYSFVKCDDQGVVLEAAEKRPISRNASAGVYWFSSARLFFESMTQMILKGDHVNGDYYICPALNQAILQGHKILAHKIPSNVYRPMKSLNDRQRLGEDGDRV